MEHWPSQAVLQQTLSTQKPEAHSEFAAQASASGLPGFPTAASEDSFGISPAAPAADWPAAPPSADAPAAPPAPAPPSGSGSEFFMGQPVRPRRAIRTKQRLVSMVRVLCGGGWVGGLDGRSLAVEPFRRAADDGGPEESRVDAGVHGSAELAADVFHDGITGGAALVVETG